MNILIGLPVIFWQHEFVLGWMKFQKELCFQDEIEFDVDIHYRKPVHIAQQKMADRAIEGDYDYLLTVDDDIYNPSLVGLRELIKADKEIIGGAMYASGFPYQLCALKRVNPSKGMMEVRMQKDPRKMYEVQEREGIQPVDLVTLGFTLIKTDLLRKMKKPYFDCQVNYETDFYFCTKCLELGITPYVDFDVPLNHRGIFRESKSNAIRNDLHNGRIAKHKADATVVENVFI